jgi:hypothetical protein
MQVNRTPFLAGIAGGILKTAGAVLALGVVYPHLATALTAALR